MVKIPDVSNCIHWYPTAANVAGLTASQEYPEECGAPVLSFSLAKPLPEENVDVSLLVRFTEVLEAGAEMAKEWRHVNMSYAAANIIGEANITGFNLMDLPDMMDIHNYEVLVKLIVNGVKSLNWSSAENATFCKYPFLCGMLL